MMGGSEEVPEKRLPAKDTEDMHRTEWRLCTCRLAAGHIVSPLFPAHTFNLNEQNFGTVTSTLFTKHSST